MNDNNRINPATSKNINERSVSKKSSKIAITLVIASFAFWGIAFLIPFLELSVASKATWTTTFIILAEIVWWIGVALVGKQALMKFRNYANPRKWFGKRKNREK
ncbi:MAG: transporter suffix domain-containing protein [Bacilli bacterium]